MIHATAEQVHDHAFGFRRSTHIESCADCGRAAAVVAGEIDALRDVLHAPPRARARIGPAGLAAAALLLAALSWLLFQPADRLIPASTLPTQEREIERLIGELQSRSSVRRDLARLALKMYGNAALEPLRRARVDPLFIDEILGVTEEDRALLQKMKTTKFSITLERGVYLEAVYELEKTVGPMEWNFRGVELETSSITMKIQDGTVYDGVAKLAATLRMPFEIRGGKVRFGAPDEIPALIPVRVRAGNADAARHVRELSNDVPARREEAFSALRELGFGAEEPLWEALGSESLETRTRAEELLKRLYTRTADEDRIPPEIRPGPRISIHTEDKAIGDLLKEILVQGNREYSLVWNGRIPVPEQTMSFYVTDIVQDGALRLALGQFQLASVSLDETTLVTGEWGGADAWSARWTPARRVLWMPATEARAIQPLIEDLLSGDPARIDKADREFRKVPPPAALDGLGCAARSLEGEALVRCRRLQREIGEKEKIWIQDAPSGADLQKLTPAQKAALDGVVAPSEEAQTLDQMLGKAGLRATYRVPVEGSLKIQGKGPKVSTLLKLLLRSHGADFRLDGDAVVVDTMANIRAAVEK